MKAFRAYEQQNSVAAIRLRLGFTQQKFAKLLGVSRSFLGGCERKRRTISSPALRKISHIEIELFKNKDGNRLSTVVPQEWTDERTKMALLESRRLAKEFEVLALKGEIDLQDMQKRYNIILQQIRDVTILMECEGTKDVCPYMPKHLEFHREELLTKLEDCDEHAQTRQRNKITTHYAAATLHNGNAARLEEG